MLLLGTPADENQRVIYKRPQTAKVQYQKSYHDIRKIMNQDQMRPSNIFGDKQIFDSNDYMEMFTPKQAPSRERTKMDAILKIDRMLIRSQKKKKRASQSRMIHSRGSQSFGRKSLLSQNKMIISDQMMKELEDQKQRKSVQATEHMREQPYTVEPYGDPEDIQNQKTLSDQLSYKLDTIIFGKSPVTKSCLLN